MLESIRCESCGKVVPSNAGNDLVTLCPVCAIIDSVEFACDPSLQSYFDEVSDMASTVNGRSWLRKCVDSPSVHMKPIHNSIIRAILA